MSGVVTIIQTGVANTASVAAAFRRLGADVEVTDDAATIDASDRVVLPGVGSFAAGMDCLRGYGLDRIVADRVRAGRPTLAVCLGLQLLCRASEESPGVEGLGVIDAVVERFRARVVVPQFGWNRVKADPRGELIEPGYAYFANSFRIGAGPVGWASAMGEHGEPFVAAVERGAVLACQFHPELSGLWGQELLGRWLVRAQEGVAC